MGANVFLAPTPVLQFFNNAGQPNAGGNILTQVGGVNYPTYQDAAGNTVLPNPIPLNSRGEISNTSGISCQLFLAAGVTYVFTQYDANGNQINQASWVGTNAIQASDYSTGALNRVVSSISALRSLSHTFATAAFVTGYYSAHDGGGGNYQYDASDTISADNGGSIIVALDGARWKLQFVDEINVAQFGAKADGATDDHAAFVNAITFMNGRGGGVVRTSFNGQSVIGSNLSVSSNVTLKGQREGVGTPGDNTSAPYNTVSGAIILNSSATISIASNASISGLLIYRQGMTFPAADASAFSGTAITVAGNDVTVRNALILGFNKAIYSTGFYRQRFDYIYGDNNNGIEITSCPDIPHINDCHMWPFATIAQSSATGSYTILQRSGTAYSIHDNVDGAMLRNCFAYGYQRGFLVSNASSTTFVNCWADGTFGPGVLNTGNIAFQIVGNSKDTRLIGWQGSAQDVAAIQVNTNPGCLTTISGGNAWYCNQDLISVISGDVIIVGNGLRNCNNGITFYGASSNAIVCENTFYALSGEPINTSVSTASISVGKNYYPDLPAGQPPVGNQLIVGGATLSGSVLNLPATIPQNVLNLYSGGSMGTMNGGYAGRTESICFQSSTTVIHTPWSSTATQNTIVCKSGANTVKAAGTVTEYTFMGLQWVEK